jgi:6-phosphofructokinase
MIIIPTSIDGDFKHNIPYGLGFDTAAEEAARQISSLLQAKAGVWYDKTLAVIIRVMGGASGTAHAERVWEAFTELHGPTSHIALTPPFPVNAAPNLRDTASEVLSLLKRHSGKAAVGLLLPDAPCDSIEAGSRSGGAKGQVILTNLLRTDSKPEFVFSDAAEIRTGVLGVPLNTRDSQMASAIVHSIITENGPGRGVRIWYDGQGFVSC